VWAVAQATMAVGTGLPVLTRSLWALAVSATLVGGTIMVATMAGLQLARELAPQDSTPLLARMTTAFAVGQIAGPVLVRLFPVRSVTGWDGIAFASALAAALLALTSAWLWRCDARSGWSCGTALDVSAKRCRPGRAGTAIDE